ncbi:hypothetical protein, partial [Sporosarcina sp. E16_3]|uniref:hypothetical protein n=1 Tax=Sporosarcina sp. E16_3 TaxID=2789293 RepID=UPI001A928F52
ERVAMTKSDFALTNLGSHDFAGDGHDFGENSHDSLTDCAHSSAECPYSLENSRDYRLNHTKIISGYYHLMNNSITIHIERHSFVTM